MPKAMQQNCLPVTPIEFCFLVNLILKINSYHLILPLVNLILKINSYRSIEHINHARVPAHTEPLRRAVDPVHRACIGVKFSSLFTSLSTIQPLVFAHARFSVSAR